MSKNEIRTNQFGDWKVFDIGLAIKLMEVYDVEDKEEALGKIVELDKHFRGV